jgi:hypothetical protein
MVPIGVSLISAEQAQRNLDNGIPDGTMMLEQTARTCKGGDQVQIRGHVSHLTVRSSLPW